MSDTNHIQLTALNRAIEVAGSQSELARAIGVSSTSVWRMVNRAKRMSAQLVLKAEAATGVSRHDLRPDLYPQETHPPAASVPPGPVSPGRAVASESAPIAGTDPSSVPEDQRTCDRSAVSQNGEPAL